MLKIKLPDWSTDCILIQNTSELPNWFSSKRLYCDLETTSGSDKLKSTNPWHNCKILGVAIVVDEERNPLYIPLRHRGPNIYTNLDYDVVKVWLQKVFDGAELWINHNIKYDANVLLNEGFRIPRMLDSLVLCKVAPQEERFSYGLTEIMKEWYYKDISPYEERLHLHQPRNTHDYGLVPIDIVAPYACVDVLSVRHIYFNLLDVIPEECHRIVRLEEDVTKVLLDIERRGMKLNMPLLENHAQAIPMTLMLIQREIERLTGFDEMRPHTNSDCKALIVTQYGLPVLEWTDKKQPSFGSDTILAYKAMRPDLATVFDWLIKYKELHKLYTGFTNSYLEQHVDGVVHPDYNQVVRTGRMSCRNPNMMQLNAEAKEYIIPFAPDRVIVDIDYSQIEFRLIAHFIKAERILREYEINPRADYHQLVANLCKIARTPAKRVNFMLGYGGGRGKCIEILSSIPEIIGELKTRDEIEKRANQVYETYHKMVPTLKLTTYHASHIMRQRGYVRTLLGRHRYLPRKAHFKAFNTAVQGSAADLFKDASVRLHAAKNADTYIIGLVHDSFVLDMPTEGVENEVARLIKVVEELPEGIKLRVPIRADAKWSSVNWRSCK